jgi:hypothetical protein
VVQEASGPPGNKHAEKLAPHSPGAETSIFPFPSFTVPKYKLSGFAREAHKVFLEPCDKGKVRPHYAHYRERDENDKKDCGESSTLKEAKLQLAQLLHTPLTCAAEKWYHRLRELRRCPVSSESSEKKKRIVAKISLPFPAWIYRFS